MSTSPSTTFSAHTAALKTSRLRRYIREPYKTPTKGSAERPPVFPAPFEGNSIRPVQTIGSTFGNRAMFVDPYRPNLLPVKPLQHEPYRTNGEAIAKACQVMDTCQTMYIVDENDDAIWNSVKLQEECAKRRPKAKKSR